MAEGACTRGSFKNTVTSLAGALGLTTEDLKSLLSPNNINRKLKRWSDRPPVHKSEGMTLLQRVVQQQLWDFLPWLIDEGADIRKKCPPHQSIVHLLMYYFDSDPPPKAVLDQLITPETINCKGKNWDTPLHIAADKRKLKFVQMLIDYGADVEAVNRDGKTPLNMALSYYRHSADGTNSVVELVPLLASSQTVNKKSLRNPSQKTPMQNALYNGLWDTIPILVEHGAMLAVNEELHLGCGSPKLPLWLYLGKTMKRCEKMIELLLPDDPIERYLAIISLLLSPKHYNNPWYGHYGQKQDNHQQIIEKLPGLLAQYLPPLELTLIELEHRDQLFLNNVELPLYEAFWNAIASPDEAWEMICYLLRETCLPKHLTAVLDKVHDGQKYAATIHNMVDIMNSEPASLTKLAVLKVRHCCLLGKRRVHYDDLGLTRTALSVTGLTWESVGKRLQEMSTKAAARNAAT